MSQKVLIMGGNGYLGWPTAMSLSKIGYEVTIVSSNKIHHKDINLNLDKKFIKTKFYKDLKFIHLKESISFLNFKSFYG